jgi:hypothetical protein
MAQVSVGQVERTDIGVESLCDQINDVRQRLLEIVRSRDDLCDVGEE